VAHCPNPFGQDVAKAWWFNEPMDFTLAFVVSTMTVQKLKWQFLNLLADLLTLSAKQWRRNHKVTFFFPSACFYSMKINQK
jgi:hypothetical protein